jgi:PleD family two-component response regulator
MSTPSIRARPVVVLASRETGALRELENALYSAGYRVVSARTEHETLEKVHTHEPDAVVLDRDLSDHNYTLCRTLRADPSISPATPIMLMQDGPPTPQNRADALRAGAWDLQGSPPNSDELLLRLSVFLQAKLEVDRLTVECLIDRSSGLYNSHGFAQRAEELAALTNRQGAPAACAVFRPAENLATRATGDRLGRAFKSVGRVSDAIGRTAHTEFAVFAPATNDWAAARMVRRMRDNVVQEVGYVAEYGRRITLRVSYSAALASQKAEPRVLLERARNGLESS